MKKANSLNTLAFSKKKSPPATSNQILNVDLTIGAVNVGSEWNGNAWNSLPQDRVGESG